MKSKLRLTLKENIVVRLVGLFIFLAPNHGMDLIADVIVKVKHGRNR